MRGTQRKEASDEDKRIDFAKKNRKKMPAFVSSPWQESDVLLCSIL